MTYHMSSATPRSCRHAVLQCIRSNVKRTQEACHHAGRPGSMRYVLCAVSDSWADHNFRGKVKLGEEGQEGKKKKKEGEKFKLTLSQCHSDKVQTGSCVLNTASTDPEGGAEEAAVARSRPIKRPRNGLVGLTGLVVLPSILRRVALFPLCVVQNQGQAAMPMPATPRRAASSGSVTTVRGSVSPGALRPR